MVLLVPVVSQGLVRRVGSVVVVTGPVLLTVGAPEGDVLVHSTFGRSVLRGGGPWCHLDSSFLVVVSGDLFGVVTGGEGGRAPDSHAGVVVELSGEGYVGRLDGFEHVKLGDTTHLRFPVLV